MASWNFRRTVAAIRLLRAQGLKLTIANVLMRRNFQDGGNVDELARELDAQYSLDPTITPMMNGDNLIVRFRVSSGELRNVEEFCAPPGAVGEDVLDGLACSAGHTACYISPYGDVCPCVLSATLRKHAPGEICGNLERFAPASRSALDSRPRLTHV